MKQNTETLNNLLISSIPQVVNMAKETQKLLAKRETGAISQSEFEELMEDLTRLDTIDRRMISLEAWREINKAVDIIIKSKTVAAII